MYKGPILWVGNYEGSTGYSTASTGAVLALHEAGYDVVPLPSQNTQLQPNSPVAQLYKHVEGKRMSILHEMPVPGKTANGYYTIFEFNRIPHAWVEQLQEESEVVFTASQFSKNAMVNTGVSAKKIFVAHHPFISDPPTWKEAPPFRLPEVKEEFKFLSVFEWVARKRPDIMIKAFTQEFDKDESVALVLRCWGQGHGSMARQINKFGNNDKRIYWLKQHSLNMASLYRSCDAYISTPAGEGFGCTFAEAMACGVPTIAPRHSGNLEYMNDNNSWLCEVGPWEPVGKVESIWWVRPSMKWRVPDVESVQEQMRAVYEEFNGLSLQERLEHPKIEEALTLKDALSTARVGEQMRLGVEWWADNFAE